MVNARIKFTGYCRTFQKTMGEAKTFPKPLPHIQALVPEKPYLFKHPTVKSGEGRFIILRQAVTQLFRDERIDVIRHKAIAIRPYAERLIQMAIEYGDCHTPTMEVCDYWMLEKNLVRKIFNVYVPRFRDCPTAFTRIFFYPTDYKEVKPGIWRQPIMSVLELKGNPYPPVIPKHENHSKSLLNVLLDGAHKRYEEDGKSLK